MLNCRHLKLALWLIINQLQVDCVIKCGGFMVDRVSALLRVRHVSLQSVGSAHHGAQNGWTVSSMLAVSLQL